MGKSNSIEIAGLTYTFPKRPPTNEIRNSNLRKSDQVWCRRTEYEQWEWNTDEKNGSVWWVDPADGQMEWYHEEIDRILNGEWIMINGVPTYFNKFAYFFHQWFVVKEGIYPMYKDTSLEFFRFYEICDNDPKCAGFTMIKGRRLGVSTMSMSIMLQYGLILQNTEQGIVSKTGIDAEKIFKGMLVNAFASLPPFLKPRISGNDTPAKVLHITKQAERITKDKGTGQKKEGLNNKIEWRPTSENTFDGDGLRILLCDEAGKWEEADIGKYFLVARKTVSQGARIRGKIIMITTVNRADKGGANYRSIWDDSDQSKRDEMGQTTTKMYRLFINGYRGMEGWIDKFGNSVVGTPTPEQTEWLKKDPDNLDPYVGSKKYSEIQRKNLAKDEEKLAEEIRQCPWEWEEVFKSASNISHFNVEEHLNQITEVESKMEALGIDTEKGELGRRGWFVKMENKRVRWIDDPKGLWYVHEFIKEEESNKFEIKNGIQIPTNTGYGGAGLDPYAHSDKSVDKGSDACCMIRKRHSSLDPENSGLPVAMFLGKMKTKKELHQQVANGIQYYGVRLLGERAPSDWIDFFIENGLASPIDHKKKSGYLVTTKRADGSEIYGIAPQDKEAREEHLTLQKESSYSDVKKVWYKRLLVDRIAFDIDNRTDYDTCIADGYSLMTLKENYQQIAPRVIKEQIIKTYKLVS